MNNIKYANKNIVKTYKTAYNRSTEWKPLRREFDGLIAIANKFSYQTAYEYIVYGLAMNGYDRDTVKSLFKGLARFEYVIALGKEDMGELDTHIAKRMACIFD